jgi:polyisoprenoid-binding protein YceI
MQSSNTSTSKTRPFFTLKRNVGIVAVLAMCANLASAASIPVTGTVGWMGHKVQDIGDSHTGTLTVKSGSIEMKNKTISGGTIVVDMTSLTSDAAKLTGHLKSPDFFDVQKFGEATFVIKKVTKITGNKEYDHEITGDMTIRGKTNPVTFQTLITETKGIWKATGKGVIEDRSKFDINYNSPAIFGLAKLADKAIADKIQLTLDVQTAAPTTRK